MRIDFLDIIMLRFGRTRVAKEDGAEKNNKNLGCSH